MNAEQSRAPSRRGRGFVGWFYRLTKRCGRPVVAFFAWWISTAYFFLFPRRLAASLRFYRALFSERGGLHHLACAWRQYKSFSRLFVERMALDEQEGPSIESAGWEFLEQAARAGKGGVIVMSHLGNWEIAARLFRRRELRLLIYMGRRQKEQIEGQQKHALAADRLNIVAMDSDSDGALGGVAGLSFLKEGGFVSMPGDLLWTQQQRFVEIAFLGRTTRLPQAPFLFALLTQAPLFVFFAVRGPAGRYQISITPPHQIGPVARKERTAAVTALAQAYADGLAEMARRYPEQWYHFGPVAGRTRGYSMPPDCLTQRR